MCVCNCVCMCTWVGACVCMCVRMTVCARARVCVYVRAFYTDILMNDSFSALFLIVVNLFTKVSF